MILTLMTLAAVSTSVLSSTDLCHFDGFTYKKGDVITIGKCLAEMTCLGNENYGNLKQLGGVCEPARVVRDDGQSGCYFDGQIYNTGDVIIIPKCLAQMTCLGRNNYGDMKQLYGVCPEH